MVTDAELRAAVARIVARSRRARTDVIAADDDLATLERWLAQQTMEDQ